MSDHQFQEREFEGGDAEPVDMVDLMDLLMGSPMGPLSGVLGREQIQELLSNLPRLTEDDLAKLGHGNKDATCPICITPLPAIIAEEEMALVMESPAHAFEEMGVTRLWIESRDQSDKGCGHLFCRRCISKWIGGGHDSCPMCRHLLIPSSAASSGTPEPATAPLNPADEAALGQLQHQMRALRAMLAGSNLPQAPSGADGAEEGDSGRARNLQNLLGGTLDQFRGRQRENDRNEYAGMYS